MAKDIGTSNLIDVWASAGPVSEPDISKKNEGWQLGEQPPHEFMNWLQNTFGEKLNHILQNGVAKWNNETQYTVGSAVEHNGFIWVTQTPNTNSTPSEANLAWKRVIEKPDLDAVTGALGTMSSQNANNVNITGGSISGISALLVNVGGTGRATLTNNAYLKGAGTNAIEMQSGIPAEDLTSGLLPKARFPSGTIIQAIRNTNAIGTVTTTSTNYVDITNAFVTITPSSTSSRILILWSTYVQNTLVANLNVTYLQRVLRGTTQLTQTINSAESGTGGLQIKGSVAFCILDAPSTTSAVTYKIQHAVNNSSSTGSNIGGFLTVMEVLG